MYKVILAIIGIVLVVGIYLIARYEVTDPTPPQR